MARRPLLFYSHYSDYSKDVLGEINKKGLKSEFVMINVHKYTQQIPQCVQRVPCIITPQKEILEDNAIMQYLEFLYKHVTPASIEAHSSDLGNGYGEQFACLGEEGPVGSGNQKYSLLDQFQTIPTPQEEDMFPKKQISDLDRLRSERDNELKHILPPMQRT